MLRPKLHWLSSLALNEVKNADKLREDAQKALESNDVLEFKSRVGIKLTTEEQEDYTSNIETLLRARLKNWKVGRCSAYPRSDVSRRYGRGTTSPEHREMGYSGYVELVGII